LKITPTGIREDFAQDLSDSEKIVLTATQGPTAGGVLERRGFYRSLAKQALLVCDRRQ
jgi:hypothetical protein